MERGHRQISPVFIKPLATVYGEAAPSHTEQIPRDQSSLVQTWGDPYWENYSVSWPECGASTVVAAARTQNSISDISAKKKKKKTPREFITSLKRTHTQLV